MARYLSVLRPVSIGTYPKVTGNRVIDIENFDDRTEVAGHMAWGIIEYENELPEADAENYDLVKVVE